MVLRCTATTTRRADGEDHGGQDGDTADRDTTGEGLAAETDGEDGSPQRLGAHDDGGTGGLDAGLAPTPVSYTHLTLPTKA